ncbi:hypothetical protein SAMN06265222_1011021 [Neorhodopirellula lusitana]|uniref:Uncharacterized protein n=1 Tax=Neorhodopirellula lusitana TaxID=445327 RepID=A0ABY1PRI2_9BACT|nr:hypothetical protein [Neorhodopirellula lusitana]SMP43882.1 hypothetical protein SAMN06265222_1011021 [Neorhodopirellula lusitana]
MDTTQLLNDALRGDEHSMAELIRLQREGKALRLYPFGRKGPLDEGMTPLQITSTENRMVRFRLGKYNTVCFPKAKLADTMLGIMRFAIGMAQHYGDRYEELESRATPGLGCISQVVNGDSIGLTFQPPGMLDYDLGLYDCRKLLDHWIVLIEQNEWDYTDCGFTAEEYCDVLTFTDSNCAI